MNYRVTDLKKLKKRLYSNELMKSGGQSKKSIKPWILAAGLLSTTLGATSAMAANPIVKPTQPVLISQVGDVSENFPYKLVEGTECAGGKCGMISGTEQYHSDVTCKNCYPESKMKDEKTLGTRQGNDTEAAPSGTGSAGSGTPGGSEPDDEVDGSGTRGLLPTALHPEIKQDYAKAGIFATEKEEAGAIQKTVWEEVDAPSPRQVTYGAGAYAPHGLRLTSAGLVQAKKNLKKTVVAPSTVNHSLTAGTPTELAIRGVSELSGQGSDVRPSLSGGEVHSIRLSQDQLTEAQASAPPASGSGHVSLVPTDSVYQSEQEDNDVLSRVPPELRDRLIETYRLIKTFRDMFSEHSSSAVSDDEDEDSDDSYDSFASDYDSVYSSDDVANLQDFVGDDSDNSGGGVDNGGAKPMSANKGKPVIKHQTVAPPLRRDVPHGGGAYAPNGVRSTPEELLQAKDNLKKTVVAPSKEPGLIDRLSSGGGNSVEAVSPASGSGPVPLAPTPPPAEDAVDGSSRGLDPIAQLSQRIQASSATSASNALNSPPSAVVNLMDKDVPLNAELSPPLTPELAARQRVESTNPRPTALDPESNGPPEPESPLPPKPETRGETEKNYQAWLKSSKPSASNALNSPPSTALDPEIKQDYAKAGIFAKEKEEVLDRQKTGWPQCKFDDTEVEILRQLNGNFKKQIDECRAATTLSRELKNPEKKEVPDPMPEAKIEETRALSEKYILDTIPEEDDTMGVLSHSAPLAEPEDFDLDESDSDSDVDSAEDSQNQEDVAERDAPDSGNESDNGDSESPGGNESNSTNDADSQSESTGDRNNDSEDNCSSKGCQDTL